MVSETLNRTDKDVFSVYLIGGGVELVREVVSIRLSERSIELEDSAGVVHTYPRASVFFCCRGRESSPVFAW